MLEGIEMDELSPPVETNRYSVLAPLFVTHAQPSIYDKYRQRPYTIECSKVGVRTIIRFPANGSFIHAIKVDILEAHPENRTDRTPIRFPDLGQYIPAEDMDLLDCHTYRSITNPDPPYTYMVFSNTGDSTFNRHFNKRWIMGDVFVAAISNEHGLWNDGVRRARYSDVPWPTKSRTFDYDAAREVLGEMVTPGNDRARVRTNNADETTPDSSLEPEPSGELPNSNPGGTTLIPPQRRGSTHELHSTIDEGATLRPTHERQSTQDLPNINTDERTLRHGRQRRATGGLPSMNPSRTSLTPPQQRPRTRGRSRTKRVPTPLYGPQQRPVIGDPPIYGKRGRPTPLPTQSQPQTDGPPSSKPSETTLAPIRKESSNEKHPGCCSTLWSFCRCPNWWRKCCGAWYPCCNDDDKCCA